MGALDFIAALVAAVGVVKVGLLGAAGVMVAPVMLVVVVVVVAAGTPGVAVLLGVVVLLDILSGVIPSPGPLGAVVAVPPVVVEVGVI